MHGDASKLQIAKCVLPASKQDFVAQVVYLRIADGAQQLRKLSNYLSRHFSACGFKVVQNGNVPHITVAAIYHDMPRRFHLMDRRRPFKSIPQVSLRNHIRNAHDSWCWPLCTEILAPTE